MPNLFVVTDQRTLADLSGAVLRSRTSAGVRKAALEAIRRANPTLDLDHLSPGTVVVIPPVPGARAAADDPIGQAVEDLVERVQDGLASLSAGTEGAAKARETELQEARDLFTSDLVKRLAASTPEVKANVASVRATQKQDDADANRALVELRESLDGWTAELDTLRGLLPR
jgi:hypothetical protein